MYVCQKAFKNLSCYRSLVFHNKEIYNRFDVEFINFHVKKGMVELIVKIFKLHLIQFYDLEYDQKYGSAVA